LAQQHHESIVELSRLSLYGSAFSLVRVAFEAFVRGEWLFSGATDSEVDSFVDGKDPPRIDTLIASIEHQPEFRVGAISNIKGRIWRALCSYTHSGGLHVQRWQTKTAVEPIYTPQEAIEVVQFAELLGTLAALGTVRRSTEPTLEQVIVEKFRPRLQ